MIATHKNESHQRKREGEERARDIGREGGMEEERESEKERETEGTE